MTKGRQDEIRVVTWSPILWFTLEATKAKDEEGGIKITESCFQQESSAKVPNTSNAQKGPTWLAYKQYK